MYLRKQGPGDVTAGDIAAAGRRRGAQPRPALATLNGKGKLEMELTVERGRGYVTRRAEQAGGPGDRPHPGRLDLLAGAQGDLQGRGDPCRAAHRLRPAHHRRRDQAVHHAARRRGLGRQDPGRAVRPGPRAQRRRPRASTSARRRRTRSSPPTWRCRSRSWTSPSAPTTASSARASTPSVSSSPAARPTCSTSATSAQKSIDEVKAKLAGMGLALKDSRARVRPGARRGHLRRRRRRQRRLRARPSSSDQPTPERLPASLAGHPEGEPTMPTPTKGPRLGGSPAHERLMLANLATSLFEHGKITTTEAKAKRLRPLAERLITFAKRGDLHARRRVLTVVRDKGVVHTLFAEIAPRFDDRPGGYTRITKTGSARATTPRWRSSSWSRNLSLRRPRRPRRRRRPRASRPSPTRWRPSPAKPTRTRPSRPARPTRAAAGGDAKSADED